MVGLRLSLNDFELASGLLEAVLGGGTFRSKSSCARMVARRHGRQKLYS